MCVLLYMHVYSSLASALVGLRRRFCANARVYVLNRRDLVDILAWPQQYVCVTLRFMLR
jgi:hypothetical protein